MTTVDVNNPLQSIRSHAARCGVSEPHLLRMAGVSRELWSRWVEGKAQPNIRTLSRILAVEPPEQGGDAA